MFTISKTFVADLHLHVGKSITLRGWIFRLRQLAKTTFVVLKDCTGEAQCVAASEALREFQLKADDAVEILGTVRRDERAKRGIEIDIVSVKILNPSATPLPFNSSSNTEPISSDILLEYRPLALRSDLVGRVFRIQAAILRYFREYLTENHFTEIVSSKIVSGGTEGGTNLFAIQYFDRVAYLAQSPQFYKEHGVAGFERVFETGHVYRAEPHATRRHLTEYYSLDLEMGFIDADLPSEGPQIFGDLFARPLSNFERQRQVRVSVGVENPHVRPQSVVLKNHLNIAPAHRDVIDRGAIDENCSAVGLLESGDES